MSDQDSSRGPSPSGESEIARELRFWKARAQALERLVERFRAQQRELLRALPEPYAGWLTLDSSQLQSIAAPVDDRVLCGDALDDVDPSEIQRSDVATELRQVWRRLAGS